MSILAARLGMPGALGYSESEIDGRGISATQFRGLVTVSEMTDLAAIQAVHRGTCETGSYEVWQAQVRNRTNFYLVKGADGKAAFIDTGLPESVSLFGELLKAAGVKPAMVERIVLTHAHPGHGGGLAILRELCPEAELCASQHDARFLKKMTAQVEEDLKPLPALFRRWGAPSSAREFVARAVEHHRLRRVWDLPPVTVGQELCAGQTVELGGVPFTVLEAPGHHPGALMFFHADGGEAFTGDNVAMDPMPVLDLRAGRNGERTLSGPAFVDSLEKLKDLSPRLLLPGHGNVVTRPEEVLDEEIHYFRGNAQRLMARLLDEKLSPWEIAGETDPQKLLPVMAQVFCFLDLLLREAAIGCTLEKGVDRYYVPL